MAIILLAVMVFSDFQMSTSLAMDNSSAVEETEVAETDAANTVKAENRLNYILVESPYLESPNTQNIVVSWGDGTEQISNMRITVQKEDGSTEEWTCSNQSGYLYVFSKEYVDESEQSTYKVTDIRFEENQQEQCFLLTDLNVEAEFGVNKAYDGIEELQPLDPEDAVETSIVTIDENGETEAQDNIASALTAVSEEMGAVAGIRSAEKAGEIVVALDPGHDNRHGGTSGSGLTEQELTLKIAKYAKAELETYNGVKVYMTRTTAACPYPKTGTSGACIEKRVQAAAEAGAKIYVSLHLNSGAASANGAEIIIPNSSWKPQLSTQGKELAEKILNELTAVGLNKRPTPIYSKDTTVNEKYPDGSISDYYSVQICAKEAGIPGIIVEHAFLSNANDVNKFLKTEAGLKKLGVADATGIAKYLGLSKGQWVQVGDGWKYLINGNYVVNQWLDIGEQRYYFDKSGYRVTGWQTIDGQKYYFMPDGSMYSNGWLSFGSTYYYMMPDGHMHTGWLSFGSTYYYLNSEGIRVTGWQTIDGQRYYFMPDGTRYSNGWLSFGSTYYYMMPDGHMHTGWLSFGSTYYYLNSEGIRVTGWQTIEGKEYYFDENGIKQEGYLIEGTSAVTAAELSSCFRSKGVSYPSFYQGSDASTLEEFCQIYVEEAKAEDIKVEVAFMQAMVETGWLKFGGAVQISQYNFAGIGALDGGAQGATFKTIREGVRAQIQHLKAYANERPLNNTQVDPRFQLVKRGSAKYVEWLGQKENPNGYGWATAKDYGYKILRLIKEL